MKYKLFVNVIKCLSDTIRNEFELLLESNKKANEKIKVLSVPKVFHLQTSFNFHHIYLDTRIHIEIFAKKDFTRNSSDGP